MKTSALPVVTLILGACLSGAAAAPAGPSDRLFNEGRQHLQAFNREPHDINELKAADGKFSAAVTAEPTSLRAVLYRTLTRLSLLNQDPDLNELLTQLGISKEGRGLMERRAKPIYPRPPIDLSVAQALARSDSRLLPEVEGAVADLGRIPENCPETCIAETNDFPNARKTVELDYGDVAMARYGLQVLRGGILLTRAYNLGAKVADLYQVNSSSNILIGDKTFNNTLTACPELLTVTNEAQLQVAKAAFDEAARTFRLAENWILNETDDQRDDLVVASFLETPRLLCASLRGPTSINLAAGYPTLLNLCAAFTPPYLTRACLPKYNNRNETVLGTFPDPTFNGVFPDMNQIKLTDLLRWNKRLAPCTNDLFDVVHADRQFVAVGDKGTILTSTDTYTWTSRQSPAPVPLKSVCAGHGKVVAVGQKGTILTSADGAGWTAAASGTQQDLEGVAAGKAGFVAVGWGGKILTSPDAIQWTERPSGTAAQLWEVMFANDQFTVTGGKGTVLISGNGEKWSAVKSGSTDSLVGIARGDGKSVIVTYEGRLLDAHDANDWCPVDSTNCAAGLFDVAAAAGRLIAVGGGGAVLMSMDGRNWRSSPTHSKETLWGVAADNEYILAVGARGRILVTFAAADPRLTDKAVSGVGGTSADLKSAIAQALPIAKARFPRDGGVLTPGAVAAPVVAISTRPREGGSPIPSVNVPPTGAVPTSPREPARVEAQTQPASSAGPVLVLSKKNASPGETVAVRVTGFSSPTKESWIGLFKARSADKDYVTYGFVNNLLREVYDVTAPDEPGAYNFRLFKDSGYTPIAVSETLEVK